MVENSTTDDIVSGIHTCTFCKLVNHMCTCMYIRYLWMMFTELQVCCGDNKAMGRSSIVTLPSRAALAEFHSVNSAPPNDAAKFALRLLGVFFTAEVLARSNCTRAEGFWKGAT